MNDVVNIVLIGIGATVATDAWALIGIAFAALLPILAGREWLLEPTLVPALLVGIGTVVAPFLIMQPGMGAGVAASRTARPGAARIQSVLMHAVFGLGLYGIGRVVSQTSWNA